MRTHVAQRRPLAARRIAHAEEVRRAHVEQIAPAHFYPLRSPAAVAVLERDGALDDAEEEVAVGVILYRLIGAGPQVQKSPVAERP